MLTEKEADLVVFLLEERADFIEEERYMDQVAPDKIWRAEARRCRKLALKLKTQFPNLPL